MIALRNIRHVARVMATSRCGAPVLIRGAATGNRVESDTMGKIDVADAVYWGAQTQRSLQNFKIGGVSSRSESYFLPGGDRERSEDIYDIINSQTHTRTNTHIQCRLKS